MGRYLPPYQTLFLIIFNFNIEKLIWVDIFIIHNNLKFITLVNIYIEKLI
jgi:hypothetical protein